MNSDGITMNYTFQLHYYKFSYYLSNSPSKTSIAGYPLNYSDSRGIFLNKCQMLFVKQSYLGEIWWNMFCFGFVLFCFNGAKAL